MRAAAKAAFAVALLLVVGARALYLSETRGHPVFEHPAVDARAYHDMAIRIASGGGYPLDVYASNPFYPYFLSVFYRVFGHAAFPVAVAHALLGIGSSLLLFDIGRRIGGLSAGLLSLLLGGLCAPFLFYEAFLLPTSIGVFVDLLLLAVLFRRRPGGSRIHLGVAGLLLGVGTLIQGNLLLFSPFLIVWLLLTEPRGRRASAVLALVAGLVLPIAPVTARNAIRGHDFVPVSSHAGINFYMGNNRAARGAFTFPDERIVLSPENVNIYDSKRIAEAASGRALKASEVSSYLTKKALGWIAANPDDYFLLLGRKIALFWNDVEVPDNADLSFFREDVPVLRLLPVGFGLIGPLGVLGIAALARGRSGALVLFFLAAQFLSALLFYAHSRYRVPFAVLFAVPAALGLLTFAKGIRRWGAPARIWVTGALALLLVLANTPGFGAGKGIARASSLTHVPDGELASGRQAEAEAELREAIRPRPDLAGTRYNLGNVLFDLGRYEEAAGQYRLAEERAPFDPLVVGNLSNALEKGGDLSAAERALRLGLERIGERADLRNRLGDVLEKLGREGEALEENSRAVALGPRHSAAWNNIGLLRFHRGETGPAIEAWEKILAYDPSSPAGSNIRMAEEALANREGDTP